MYLKSIYVQCPALRPAGWEVVTFCPRAGASSRGLAIFLAFPNAYTASSLGGLSSFGKGPLAGSLGSQLLTSWEANLGFLRF